MKNVDFRAMFRRARPHGEGEARALSGMKGHLCALLITLVPGVAIMLTILSLNLVGDGLRDALDPKLKD